MALAWLFYCAFGSPWFWPWYRTTFVGIYALVEATDFHHSASFFAERVPVTVHTLAFSMLGLYCFFVWLPAHVFVPMLPDLRWLYLSVL